MFIVDSVLNKAYAKATSRAQKVGKWTLLSDDFSEDGGEQTPSLKLKPAEKYKKKIKAMYA